MNRFLTVLGLALGLSASAAASAGSYGDEDYDWARVVRVDPILDTSEEPVYRDECREVPVEYHEPRYARRGSGDGTGGAILGAIIGGAIGNQIGSGDGRRAATAAGAIIGAQAGYDNATRGRYVAGGRTRHGYEERCETRTEYRREERVVGYDVEYEYNGRTYHTQTDAHPGDRLRVVVHVEPAS